MPQGFFVDLTAQVFAKVLSQTRNDQVSAQSDPQRFGSLPQRQRDAPKFEAGEYFDRPSLGRRRKRKSSLPRLHL